MTEAPVTVSGSGIGPALFFIGHRVAGGVILIIATAALLLGIRRATRREVIEGKVIDRRIIREGEDDEIRTFWLTVCSDVDRKLEVPEADFHPHGKWCTGSDDRLGTSGRAPLAAAAGRLGWTVSRPGGGGGVAGARRARDAAAGGARRTVLCPISGRHRCGGLHVMKVHETMDPAMAEALVRELGFARKPRREEVLQNGLTYAIGWDEGVLAVYILMGSETVHNKVSYHLSRHCRAAKRGR
jgi:hypothetical protein